MRPYSSLARVKRASMLGRTEGITANLRPSSTAVQFSRHTLQVHVEPMPPISPSASNLSLNTNVFNQVFMFCDNEAHTLVFLTVCVGI